MLPLPVYLLDKWGHHGAVLHEVVGARVLLEVVVDLLQLVVAACKNYHEECHYARETLQTTIPR